MSLKVFILGLFALVALVSCADAFCTKKINYYCRKTKGWWRKRCVQWDTKYVWYCPSECRVGKREKIPGDEQKKPTEEDFPCHFEAYDLNRDGQVDFKEFMTSLKFKPTDKASKGLFDKADVDGSKSLSCEELTNSGMSFKCEVACPESNSQDEEDEVSELLQE